MSEYINDMTCPKCHYKRLPTDTAPDWMCPKCGVAYNKIIHEKHWTQEELKQKNQRFRNEIIEKNEEKKSTMWTDYKTLILPIMVIVLGLMLANKHIMWFSGSVWFGSLVYVAIKYERSFIPASGGTQTFYKDEEPVWYYIGLALDIIMTLIFLAISLGY